MSDENGRATNPLAERVDALLRRHQEAALARDELPVLTEIVDPDKPRLGEVSFEPGSDDAAACLRIHVPAGHPPGVYNGLLIEEATSRPAGTVSVSITE